MSKAANLACLSSPGLCGQTWPKLALGWRLVSSPVSPWHSTGACGPRVGVSVSVEQPLPLTLSHPSTHHHHLFNPTRPNPLLHHPPPTPYFHTTPHMCPMPRPPLARHANAPCRPPTHMSRRNQQECFRLPASFLWCVCDAMRVSMELYIVDPQCVNSQLPSQSPMHFCRSQVELIFFWQG